MAFAIVARERNMRKAAQLLLISQPPLTRKIRRLENRLGLVLFERHSRGMDLTEDGAKVLKMLGPFLAMAKDMAKKLEGMVNRTTQKISLGLTTALNSLFLNLILNWLEKNSTFRQIIFAKNHQGLSEMCCMANLMPLSLLFRSILPLWQFLSSTIPKSCWLSCLQPG